LPPRNISAILLALPNSFNIIAITNNNKIDERDVVIIEAIGLYRY
jgi:predicted nuclease of restriction endonuclease-like (RecB) superfamily